MLLHISYVLLLCNFPQYLAIGNWTEILFFLRHKTIDPVPQRDQLTSPISLNNKRWNTRPGRCSALLQDWLSDYTRNLFMTIGTGNTELFYGEDAARLLGCLCGFVCRRCETVRLPLSVKLLRGFVCERHVHHREEALWKLSCFHVLCLLVSAATQTYVICKQPGASIQLLS